MANSFARLCLFLSSYLPLGLVVAVLYWDKQRVFGLGVLSVCLVGLLGALLFLRGANKSAALTIGVTKLQRKDSEAMAYIVSYIVPFLAFPEDSWQKWTAMAIFFLVLAVLYVRSDMIHINPILNLFGYYIFEATLQDGETVALISKQPRIKSGELRVSKAAETVYIHRHEPLSPKLDNSRAALP